MLGQGRPWAGSQRKTLITGASGKHGPGSRCLEVLEGPQVKADRLHLGVPKVRRKGHLGQEGGDEFSFNRHSLVTYLHCTRPFAEFWGVPQSCLQHTENRTALMS